MNYLAHLFLAGENEDAQLGGLLGDFEKGSVIGKYTKETEREIKIHRKIDFFTDNHSIIKETKKLLPVETRKYGNILLDVFFDHMLAQKWDDYHEVCLNEFTEKVYSLLLRNIDILPIKLSAIVPIMIKEDWLTSYQEFSGFEMAITRISKRLKQENNLLDCIADVGTHYFSFSLSFDLFFPQVVDYACCERELMKQSCFPT